MNINLFVGFSPLSLSCPVILHGASQRPRENHGESENTRFSTTAALICSLIRPPQYTCKMRAILEWRPASTLIIIWEPWGPPGRWGQASCRVG